jgi:branched-chain amino acid transport system permease protein
VSEPVARSIFEVVSYWSTQIGWGAIPEIESRSAQMRVFVLGLVITIALRFAPKGLIPEVVRREG